jgi:hypothetical protein
MLECPHPGTDAFRDFIRAYAAYEKSGTKGARAALSAAAKKIDGMLANHGCALLAAGALPRDDTARFSRDCQGLLKSMVAKAADPGARLGSDAWCQASFKPTAEREKTVPWSFWFGVDAAAP